MKRGKRKFAVIDCETNPFEFEAVITPFIWGYYDEQGFQYFYNQDEFVKFIKSEDRIIYAHNGGKFDFHFLLSDIDPQENMMIINGRISVTQFGNCELRDSYLLLAVPLSAYKKDEIDYQIFRPESRDIPENKKNIISYLHGDCKYLYDILSVQFDIYGQKLTLASSAFDFWNKNFNPYKNKPKTNAAFFSEFKKYYYGGRVECFQKGVIKKPFKVYDINSAYPTAMLEDHPYGSEYVVSNDMPENMGLSFFTVRGKSHGAFPFRNPETKGLSFPHENQIYHVTGWELDKALKTNTFEMDDLIECRTFVNSINFKDYVFHFYDEKALHKNGDEAKYLLAKLYMNALYGKFAQSSIDHRDYDLIEPQYIVGYKKAGYCFEGMIGGNALMSKQIPIHKQRFYNVATAASITGWVRAFLFEHILNSKEPLYCDTDSIACVEFNGSIGKELGQWECEGDFVQAAIGGKKLYSFKRQNPKIDKDTGNEIWYKLSSKGARLTEKEILAIASGEEIEYKNIAPTFSINKEPVYITRNIRMT